MPSLFSPGVEDQKQNNELQCTDNSDTPDVEADVVDENGDTEDADDEHAENDEEMWKVLHRACDLNNTEEVRRILSQVTKINDRPPTLSNK